jgi:hypothetical protein
MALLYSWTDCHVALSVGIQGLLPFVAELTNKTAHISEFANKRVAIDGYCWLHTGAHW